MPYIIGIAGNKGAGKDTVASMINYIFAKGITRAKYSEWVIDKDKYYHRFADTIIHFADTLKNVLSIIYNIPRKYFNNRKYKDELYYSISTGNFINEDTIELFRDSYHVITIDELKDNTINKILKQYRGLNIVTKLRVLMQYFGTEICREHLGDNIWIKSTINKAVDIATSRQRCIIPDVRFANEAKAINGHRNSLYGVLIIVNRKNNENNNHSSENIDFKCDYIIDNNGTLTELFYKVLLICETINSKYNGTTSNN